MKLKEVLQAENIAILWFWKEGQSTLRFLTKQGRGNITVLDKNPENEKVFWEFKVLHKNITWIFWWEYLESLQKFDIIIKTPGISPFQEKLLPHRDKIISQSHIFFWAYSWKVIGVTGTKGKSTISTLLYKTLCELGYTVKLVWNIGSPVLDEIDISSAEMYDFVVYELSSYMLQDFVPQTYISILNNIYPCHLDWHYNSFFIYKEAKINILKNATIKIVNSELKNEKEILELENRKYYFWEKGEYEIWKEGIYHAGELFLKEKEISLLWKHNQYNISWILTALWNIESDALRVKSTLIHVMKNFSWLPHRLESIGIFEGIEFIDDSIATTPESTIAAITALNWRLQSILLGWQDSGFCFWTLRKTILESSIENIIAFPDTSIKVFPEIQYRPYDVPFEMMIEGKNILFLKTQSMKIAVNFCYRNTLPGKIALLSSWAPSFSLWKSYKDKAEQFKKEVQNF